jgi:hypothetical protein
MPTHSRAKWIPLLVLFSFVALAIYGFRIAVARPVLTTALDE